uniref:Putative chloride channel toxin Tx800 n=1 Tax=Buthus israelis TaxID=2899555 RepID=B8XH26_BUTIS|nr:putative chloride channel toxin Tx800 [Buthus occitanus israelis]
MKFLYEIVFIALFLTVMIATHTEAGCEDRPCKPSPVYDRFCWKCCGGKGKCDVFKAHCVCSRG